MTSGRSGHGSTCGCSALSLPNAVRILPAFTRSPPGTVGNVMKPSSRLAPSSPNETKKSPRAYGSTTAWNDTSASLNWSDGDGDTGFDPAVPRKLPMTAMSGLKTFEDCAGAGWGGGSDRAPRGAAAAACAGGLRGGGATCASSAARRSPYALRTSSSSLRSAAISFSRACGSGAAAWDAAGTGGEAGGG